MNNFKKGKYGERLAINFFESKGIKIIEKNYFTEFGEIDLIGIENKTIIFIEVKLRKNYRFGAPYESINQKKLDRIKKSALIFLSENNYSDYDCRFDILSIINSNNSNKIQYNWIKNQFFY